mgnify:CR=1 FL=1
MKIPLLEFKDSNKIENDTWQEILVLAADELSSTEGLVDALKKRQRIALYKYKGDIVGIAALDIVAEEFEGKKVCSIYTGNTWIRQDWRNKNLIQALSFVAMIQAKIKYPFHSLFWFFGSNNYMSYRLLYNNFDKYWPNIEKETPEWEMNYMRHLGMFYFDSTLDAETLVWSQKSARSFKDEDTKLTNKQKNDPHIDFYVKRNPGYVHGDRLMCMAPLDKNTIPHVIKLSVSRLLKSMNKKK